MWRRLTSALVLVFLAPFIGELLLGNTPAHFIYLYLVELPMYGFGALFIREIARRTRRGWPTILTLAAAYGVAEEGLGDMTLFNPHYLGLHLLRQGNAWGIGWVWWLHVLTLHVVWSIGTSIALTEALHPRREHTPWLGRLGLVVSGVMFLLGTAFIHVGFNKKYHLSPTQVIGSLALIAVLAVIAFLFPRGTAPVRAGRRPKAPTPLSVGTAALVTSSVFLAVNQFLPDTLSALVPILTDVALYLFMIVAVRQWSRRPGWNRGHRLALAAGATLSYCWFGLGHVPHDTVDLAGQAAFALLGLGIVGLTVHRGPALTRQDRLGPVRA